MEQCTLVIDIGNTSAKYAVFRGKVMLRQWRTRPLGTDLPTDFLTYPIQKALFASVVELSEAYRAFLAQFPFPVYSLRQLAYPSVEAVYAKFPTMGEDRAVAVVEAVRRFPHCELLVVDSGTAVTYERINAAGEYIGGNIAPGLKLRLKALHEYTSLLPLVDVRGDIPLFGYDTDTAIRAGVVIGMKYEIEGNARTVLHGLPDPSVFRMLFACSRTFMFSSDIQPYVNHCPLLVLEGLNTILRNSNV